MTTPSAHQLWIVAKHEFEEAIASKLLVFVLLLYLAGSSLFCVVFLKGFEQAELQARRALAAQSNAPVDAIPDNLVREQAVPALIELVGDEDLRRTLAQMPLLAIFYTLIALSSVALLVLATSSATHAADIASGSVRFALVRCRRSTWVLGKFVGQAMVLLLGLVAGAIAAGGIGMWLDDHFSAATWPWLMRATAAAWIYGLAYLGLFCGISLHCRTVMKARMLSLTAWIGIGILHLMSDLEVVTQSVPGGSALKWLFPAEYKQGLWLNSGSLLVSILALCTMSLFALLLSASWFNRRDA